MVESFLSKLPSQFLYSFFLKAVQLASRFGIVVLIPMKLDYGEMASWVLIQSLFLFSVFAGGFELYLITNKKLASSKVEDRDFLINQHLAAIFPFFIAMLVLVFVFAEVRLEQLVFYVLLLSIFEFLNQECYRLLIALSRPVAAHSIFFVRNSLWVLVLIAYAFLGVDISLNDVLSIWLCFSIIALLIGGWYLLGRERVVVGLWENNFNLLGMLKEAMPLFLAALFAKAFFFIDRMIIGSDFGEVALGAYGLSMSINFALFSLFESTVISVLLPKIALGYGKGIKKLVFICYFVCGVTILFVQWFLFPVLCVFVNKPQYVDYHFLAIGAALGFAIFLASQYFYFKTYSSGKYFILFFSSMGGALIFLLSYYLALALSLNSFIISFCLCFFFIVVMRMFLVKET